MNALFDLFSSSLAETITRTLLHSLWQSAGILILLILILKMTPQHRSGLRYFFAYASIVVVLCLTTITFIEGWTKIKSTERDTQIIILQGEQIGDAILSVPQNGSVIDALNSIIPAVAPYCVILWIFGVSMFLFRLGGSWFYLYKLRSNSCELTGEIADQLNVLARQFQISKKIRLAESVRVHAPMVIGYLKPMLLIPAGFVSGLSPEQVEAIFIHEVTHIKRQDYLLNIIQSIAEALLFFNPFVWIISGYIRREREHCCDDAVIHSGRNAFAYVKALAYLEEHRIAQTSLALSAIGTKNQLLDRIKRIMEKSVDQYSFRDKLVPVVLLIIGIACASWVSINKNNTEARVHDTLAADTTIKKKSKSSTLTRKKTVTTDAQGKPTETVEENFSGDEELRHDMDIMVLHDFEMPETPPVPDFDIMVPPPFRAFPLDSLPRRAGVSAHEWVEFRNEFQARFKEEFADFYAKNQDQINKMMTEMQADFQGRFDFPSPAAQLAYIDTWNLDEVAKVREEALRGHEEQMRRHHEDLARHENEMRHNSDAMRKHEEELRKVEGDMAKWEKNNRAELQKIEQGLKDFEKKMKAFEQELKQNLRQDGYLQENERIRNMNWDDDAMEINGKSIREKDVKKYQKLHEKHFGKKNSRMAFSELGQP